MEIPNPIKVQVDVNFNFNGKPIKENSLNEAVKPADLSNITLDSFRSTIHEAIIEEFKEIYKNEEWKQILLNRAGRS
jgi:hypothetical protein